MNIKKLKEAEKNFLKTYPEGFNSPEMIEIGKKHKMEKMVELAQSSLTKSELCETHSAAEHMIKLVTRSSMVSVFEKPKFRDAVRALSPSAKSALVDSLAELLHGNEEKGFSKMVELLVPLKLAKWPLLTVYGAYFRPDKEVFCKPTTVKHVIDYFELEELVYKPRPSYEFYSAYREIINNMKLQLDPALSPSNAAFSGFLMMTMEDIRK